MKKDKRPRDAVVVIEDEETKKLLGLKPKDKVLGWESGTPTWKKRKDKQV